MNASASSQLPFAGGSAGADLGLQEEAFTDGIDRQVRVRLVAPAYLSQMAAYSAVLGAIYPGRRIRTALLWTESLTLMPLPPEALQAALAAALAAASP